MAIMKPEIPRECDKYSREEEMFYALSKLPEEYYVFHSFKIVTVKDNKLFESETDFVIFHPQQGILVLEAKAGKVYYENEEWYYGSGIQMNHGGPYKQAAMNKWKLSKYIKDKRMSDVLEHCKLIHAVWFPSISQRELNNIVFPSDGDRKITLTAEALDEPEKYIKDIFELSVGRDISTNLTVSQEKKLLNNVLCPEFSLVPSLKGELEFKRRVFNRLLNEQSRLLDYLEEQPNAIINGPAGSGKTMIALEKARRASELGDPVLFLCYNKLLRDYLYERYYDGNISFYTIDGLSCKLCNISVPDMGLLTEKMESLFCNGEFPYKHIIIDEGQDFGQERFEETKVIELLETIVLDESVNGTFYIFYDKLQLIQGKSLPSYISEADCKLTLYKNCRNTKNIAKTSMRPFPDMKKPRLNDGALEGNTPNIFIESDAEKIINDIHASLDLCIENKIDDIVILTCKTENKSILSSNNGVYKYRGKNIKFSTCRKFKGLEADAIILIDIDAEILMSEDAIRRFYVGTSRARFELSMIASMNEEKCANVLRYYGKRPGKRPKKKIASFLNAFLVS